MTKQSLTPSPQHPLPPPLQPSPTPAPAKPPFVPPVLTKHGPVAAVTQKNRYAPFFQMEIVAETSP